MTLLGYRIIIGWNNEPTLRYGYHREPVGAPGRYFSALGVWPLLIGWAKVG